MPEGDTIHRTAGRLRPALAGQVLRRFEAARLVGDRPRPGTRIDDVEAVGKHLLIHFSGTGASGGLTLRTHLRMTGSWHLYRTGERWRKPAHLVRALVEVDGWVAVCFSAPVVRTSRRAHDGRPGDGIAHLGPDLCLPEPDIDAAVARMAACAEPGDEIGTVLLDQRVACGVGNVYKSEACFACGIDPATPVGDLDEPARRRLLTTAARLLRANLGAGARTTTGGSLAVYGRARRPCRRCGTPIRARRQGDQARSTSSDPARPPLKAPPPPAATTYWCPTCQGRPVASNQWPSDPGS